MSSSSAISNASIVIKDANGKEIRRIAIPATGGTVQWDGRDANGAMVQPGAYNVSVDSESIAWEASSVIPTRSAMASCSSAAWKPAL